MTKLGSAAIRSHPGQLKMEARTHKPILIALIALLIARLISEVTVVRVVRLCALFGPSDT